VSSTPAHAHTHTHTHAHTHTHTTHTHTHTHAHTHTHTLHTHTHTPLHTHTHTHTRNPPNAKALGRWSCTELKWQETSSGSAGPQSQAHTNWHKGKKCCCNQCQSTAACPKGSRVNLGRDLAHTHTHTHRQTKDGEPAERHTHTHTHTGTWPLKRVLLFVAVVVLRALLLFIYTQSAILRCHQKDAIHTYTHTHTAHIHTHTHILQGTRDAIHTHTHTHTPNTHTHTHFKACELLKSNKPQDFMLHETRSSSSSPFQPKFVWFSLVTVLNLKLSLNITSASAAHWQTHLHALSYSQDTFSWACLHR